MWFQASQWWWLRLSSLAKLQKLQLKYRNILLSMRFTECVCVRWIDKTTHKGHYYTINVLRRKSLGHIVCIRLKIPMQTCTDEASTQCSGGAESNACFVDEMVRMVEGVWVNCLPTFHSPSPVHFHTLENGIRDFHWNSNDFAFLLELGCSVRLRQTRTCRVRARAPNSNI